MNLSEVLRAKTPTSYPEYEIDVYLMNNWHVRSTSKFKSDVRAVMNGLSDKIKVVNLEIDDLDSDQMVLDLIVRVEDESYSSNPDAMTKYCDEIRDRLSKVLRITVHVEIFESHHACSVCGIPSIRVVAPNVHLTADGITSLRGITGKLDCMQLVIVDPHSSIKSGVLELLKMKSLRRLESNTHIEWVSIVNKHLSGDRDMLDCQEDLRSAGLKEYARP